MPTKSLSDWAKDGWRWKTFGMFKGMPFHPNCGCVTGGEACASYMYCTCDPQSTNGMTVTEYYNKRPCLKHDDGIPPMKNGDPSTRDSYSEEYLENEFPDDAAALRRLGLRRGSQYYKDRLLSRRG